MLDRKWFTDSLYYNEIKQFAEKNNLKTWPKTKRTKGNAIHGFAIISLKDFDPLKDKYPELFI